MKTTPTAGSAGPLRVCAARDFAAAKRSAVDAETLSGAAAIVDAVKCEGENALRRFAEKFGDLRPGDEIVLGDEAMSTGLEAVSDADRAVLERAADRIRRFADAQRRSLQDMKLHVDGGEAGHWVAPVERAGCYAPGGRYPLPSSVLMTVLTARAAGVDEVWLASPRPGPEVLAAAAVAGADRVVAVGGAHAIAALAYGAGPVPACDVIVGPGNRWVTAAKMLVSGDVGIDLLAGPSELVVLADDSADAEVVAADLLAQAEHDTDALPVLVTTSSRLAAAVNREVASQLVDLPTRETAEAALDNGAIVLAKDLDEAVLVCDRLAPEHLQVLTENPRELVARLHHWGGLFIGATGAEVLGDYGAGPNHTLPTGGVARYRGGLSVVDFLRIRTWMRLDSAFASRDLIADAVALARMEGLEGHARAAEKRLSFGNLKAVVGR
jgi:phosphoribosyl-ATP pyrophosphohydrolase/phosphoribosyl-AMP cyclohydrolase/histidinol dehydrogenase